eukprot:5418043-Karenia_brevis.AAC.1
MATKEPETPAPVVCSPPPPSPFISADVLQQLQNVLTQVQPLLTTGEQLQVEDQQKILELLTSTVKTAVGTPAQENTGTSPAAPAASRASQVVGNEAAYGK